MVDTIGRETSGLGIRCLFSRYMRIAEAVLLNECLTQGGVIGDEDLYDLVVFEEDNARVFISTYARPSYPMATPNLCITSRTQAMQVGGRRVPQIDILHLQYHLAYLRYLTGPLRHTGHASLSEDQPGLILERHSAKIRRLSYSRTPGAKSAGQTSKRNSDAGMSEEHFEECMLSMSLYLYGEGGEFRLLLAGDKGALVRLSPSLPFEERHASSSLRLDPNSLGHLAGLTHFLVHLVHLMDTWHEGWKETLNKIDDIVGFEVIMANEPPPTPFLSSVVEGKHCLV